MRKNKINCIFYEKGYIEYQEVESDRRNKYVLFTSSGKQYADEIMKPLMEREEKAIKVLSNEERNEMVNMLERCYKEYQKLI